MKFEGLLDEIGSFGLYQKILCFFLIPITTGICGLTYYSQLFVLTSPPHTCKQGLVPNSNGEVDHFPAGHVGWNATSNAKDLQCWQYNTNFSGNLTEAESCSNGWEYDNTAIFPTLTSQNNWVCDESWRPYIIIVSFWVGNTIGAWIFGLLSDRYGRRPVIAASIALYTVSAVASVFVVSFYPFLILRTLVGFAHVTVSHLPFVYVVEHCGVKSRVIPLLTIMMSYTIASIIAPPLATLIWHWKTLLAISTTPAFVVILFYRWLPESPSWLATKGRYSEAKIVLKKMAEINQSTISEDTLVSFFEDSPDKGSEAGVGGPAGATVITALKYKNLRKNIFLVLFVWMISCLCYYGHCQNTSNLGENIFSNYLYGALVEVPSWCGTWLIHRFGRKGPLFGAYLLSGLAGITYSLLPAGLPKLSIGFALLGRMSITIAYYITLQYGPEIFPTIVRGQGVAISETFGGVAIFISPLIVYLGEFYSYLPLLIFGSLSILGAFATCLLPETGKTSLPQTLQQGEDFGAQNNIRCCKKNANKE